MPIEPKNKDELSPTYYYENFEHVLNTVVRHQAHLLSEEESNQIARYRTLNRDAQLLWLRLLSRKGALIRIDKLNYSEIPFLKSSLQYLDDTDFIEINPDLPLAFWLDILTLRELRQFFNIGKTLNRSNSLQVLIDQYDDTTIIAKIMQNTPAVAVKNSAFTATLRLLYFGNLYQDLSEFIIAELGHIHYPQYDCDPDLSPFKNRVDIERAFKRFHFNDELDEFFSREHGDPEALITTLKEADYLSANQWYKLGYKLERMAFLNAAKRSYILSGICPSRERLARVLIKEGKLEGAAAMVSDMLKNPLEDSERYSANRIAKTLNKKGYDFVIEGDTFKTEYIDVEEITHSPEITAIHYYKECDVDAHWYENSVWLTLFGLLFYDVIFMSVNGAFLHPFQRAPLDLHSRTFFAKRRRAFEDRLLELQQQDVAFILEKEYQQNYNSASRLIDWQLPLQVLKNILSILPKDALLTLMLTIAKDIRSRRAGFPDLVLMSGRTIQLREVKGPGDQLRDNQRFWLNWFTKNGWDVGVVYVRTR